MKTNYITVSNDFYEILIPEQYMEFGNKVLEYSTKKIKEFLDFFKEDSYGKIVKAAFLISREDFLDRIRAIKSPEDNMPPEWATGCFYGEETQVLLQDDPYDSFYVLVHETFHLLFSKFVYDKNDWNRMIWLDEALAGNFDDTTERIVNNGYFKKLIIKYMNCSSLPIMTNFSFKDGLFKTDEYNGYDLFKIIGRYLVETMDSNELLEYINDYDRLVKDSETILNTSISYFIDKYELKK